MMRPTRSDRRKQIRKNARFALRDIHKPNVMDEQPALNLMRAIYTCALAGIPLPKWAGDRFRASFEGLDRMDVVTLDEAFGAPYLFKGIRQKKREKQLRYRVHQTVRETRTRKRLSLGDQLFEEVGRKLGIGKSECNRLYYMVEREQRELMAAIDLLPKN